MHIFAMVKFLGLSCDIILYLFFSQVLFTAVILPIFVILTRIFFWNIFLWEILVGSFAESCLSAVYPAGFVRGLWKIRLQFRPKLWTAPSLLSGTSFGLISWCHRWTTYLTSSRHTTGDISTAVLVWCTPDWSSYSTPTWRLCRMMIMEWCFSPPLQAISSLLILRSSVTSSESQCSRFRPAHTMRWCFLHPWMISGNSSVPFPKVRSALLRSGLVPCHPPTACWPISFSRTSGLLPGAVIWS
jgi:hypothetical protein